MHFYWNQWRMHEMWVNAESSAIIYIRKVTLQIKILSLRRILWVKLHWDIEVSAEVGSGDSWFHMHCGNSCCLQVFPRFLWNVFCLFQHSSIALWLLQGGPTFLERHTTGCFPKCHSDPLPLPKLLPCFLLHSLDAIVLPLPSLICCMPHRKAAHATSAIHATVWPFLDY